MKLAEIFSDNAVFQAEKKICLFGRGKGTLKVVFCGKTYRFSALEDEWKFYLAQETYGGPYTMELELEGEKRVLRNIMIGDVILCAGQSNAQFEVREESDAESVEENENVRFFVSDRIEKHESLHSADGWQVATKEKLLRFSALGFHVADDLNKKKHVAVGVVGCSQNASVIRSWLDKESLTEDVFVPVCDRHRDCVNRTFSEWNGDSALYEHTFLPVASYPYGAVVWYQGESDTTIAEGKIYKTLLKRLIALWRKDTGDRNLPFVVVQICDFQPRNDEGWKCIQRAQEECAKESENVKLVTSSDVCEHGVIHPADKRKLAEKIAAIL